MHLDRSLRAAPIVLSVAALLVGGSSACSDDCGDVNCGSGVFVWWERGDLPSAAGYRLCVDGACEAVEPNATGDDDLSVSPEVGTGDDEVEVRLELLDGAGTVTQTFDGGGEKSGRCCPGIELRARPDGTLERERP